MALMTAILLAGIGLQYTKADTADIVSLCVLSSVFGWETQLCCMSDRLVLEVNHDGFVAMLVPQLLDLSEMIERINSCGKVVKK